MKFGIVLPYAEGSMSREEVVEFVTRADQLGFHSVWVPEAWTFDAFMMLTSLVEHTSQIQLATGIVNVYSRTPALLGQSIATLDSLSNGRAILGIGASGPQVISGWHGMSYDKPVTRTREAVDIVRTILRRDPLAYEGEIFNLRMGLKLINHPLRPDVPITIASMGPKNVEMTAEIADGWLPVLYSAEKAGEIWGDALAAGKAKRSPDLAPLEVMPTFTFGITEDPKQRAMAEMIGRAATALYVGGMGSRKKNFYNDLVCRYGWEAEAKEIQELYLTGKQQEAAAKVPDDMLEEFTIVGDQAYAKDRVAALEESGATTVVAGLLAVDQPSRLKMLEDLAALA